MNIEKAEMLFGEMLFVRNQDMYFLKSLSLVASNLTQFWTPESDIFLKLSANFAMLALQNFRLRLSSTISVTTS